MKKTSKRNGTKRALSLLLALMMCLSLLPGVALAVTDRTGIKGSSIYKGPFSCYIPVDGTQGGVPENGVQDGAVAGIKNDQYYGTTSYNGTIYGWGITGVKVKSYEMETPSVVGMPSANNGTYGDIYNKVYNIVLDAGTDDATEFTMFCDNDNNHATSYTYPAVYKSYGAATGGSSSVLRETDIVNHASYNYSLQIALEDGEATTVLYTIPRTLDSGARYVTYTFNFETDTSNEPTSEEVSKIEITHAPNKTTYADGSSFSKTGMVVMATLLEPDTEPVEIKGYTVEPETLNLDTTEVTIRFGEHTATQPITVVSGTVISNLEITNGQLYGDLDYSIATGYHVYTRKVNQYDAIAWYGQSSGNFTFDIGEGVNVYVGSDQTPKTGDENGLCTITLPSSPNGTTTNVKLVSGTLETTYKFTCYTQAHSDLPTRVEDYLCMASQYTNGFNMLGPYGLNTISTLRGGIGDTTSGSMADPPTSLGNFGGYITYYYDTPIVDNPNNPYGIDFIVYGNPWAPTESYAEPGNVLVSENGTDWYTLAGSFHYDDIAIWNYSMTYSNQSGKAAWSASDGKSGTSYSYPRTDYYTLFKWQTGMDNSMTLTGTLLKEQSGTNEYGNGLPPFPAFGYADVGTMSLSNAACNPYDGTVSTVADGFDLKWAVGDNGLPIDLTGKAFHYVKVQTATNIQNTAIGEKSTEVLMMRVAQAGGASVGVTDNLTGIKVAGVPVSSFTGNTYIYNDVPVPETGAFVVEVTAAEGANVYINSTRGTSATFANKPAHDIIRIIVQEGEKEPVIYYLSLKEDDQLTGLKSSTITFDAYGGTVNGKTTDTITYTEQSENKTFPTPTYDKRTFLGWYDNGGNKYTEYAGSMPETLALTARWEYIQQQDDPEKLNEKFRLIGATPSSGDIDLSNGDYKGSKYVTWVPTKQIEMKPGDTVYDLFVKAMTGYTYEGAEKNYVSGIKAPTVLGGEWLRELDNGQRSGWMYTVGNAADLSDQRHPTRGLREQDLEDGMIVIWHYVNDYAYEVADWNLIGGGEYPSSGTTTYHNKWLEAEDRLPNTGDYEDPTPIPTPRNSLRHHRGEAGCDG